MRIAVLAWGSLVWQPANAYGEIAIEGPWHDDGPALPVEFARISADGRLTLVVVPGYPHRSTVLWARSAFGHLDAAVANLAERETGAPPSAVHGVGPSGPLGAPDPAVAAEVKRWLGPRGLDAAVWTGLPPGPGWGDEGWSQERALAYVASLEGPVRQRAAEYLREAPSQIDTPVRRALRDAVIPGSSPPPSPTPPG